MESVSNYFLRLQNWRENIFTVESWTGISVSLPVIRILLRSSTSVVDVENNVRLSSPKTCPFLVAIFQTRNVVFVSRLSFSLRSDIWPTMKSDFGYLFPLIASRFQQFDISSRRDEIRGTTEKQFSFGKQRLARITSSFIFYANRIIPNRKFFTIM